MGNNIQAIRGMNDILPAQSYYWQKIEQQLHQLFETYGYQEIRLPILEKTELFRRGIGEVTDIVEKEMYTFQDRNQEQMTLRPEGTAGCVRAAIEHGLLYHQQQKLWYSGPMFRYERPQKGRYRQFHHVGVETFGYAGPAVEAELILMMARLWRQLGIDQQIHLQLNSLGTPETRAHYREAFVAFCRQHEDQLDEDSQRRLSTNPLRILDSKNPALQTLLQKAPKIIDYLDSETRQHLDQLCALLKAAQVNFTLNPRLVRGLDYYTGTVFEWVTESLGAQGAVCAGGRYDGLVAQLNGPVTSAVGFAIGMERVVALYEATHDKVMTAEAPDVYIMTVGAAAEQTGMVLAEELHDKSPRLKIIVNLDNGNLKTQMKRAAKSGARYALIIGEDELQKNIITYKDLQERWEKPFSKEEVIQQLINFK